MPHLKLEALARLVDEAPDAAESSHLESCEECRRELDALQEQTMALSELPRLAPTSDGWSHLRRRLRQEGLSRRRMRVSPGLVRAAAAVVLLLLGGASGWALRGLNAETTAVAADAMGGSEVVADAADARPAEEGTSQKDAQFEAALEDYMMRNTGPASDPAARLAALDNIVLTTAEALNESPTDPVINGYYMLAQAQRRAVLRQITTSTTDPVF